MSAKTYISIKHESPRELIVKLASTIKQLNDFKPLSAIENIYFECPIFAESKPIGNHNYAELPTHNEITKRISFLEENSNLTSYKLRITCANYSGLTLCVESPIVAKIEFGHNGKNWDSEADVKRAAYEAVKKNFELISEFNAINEVADATTRVVLKAYQENIELLQNLSSKMLLEFSEERQKLEASFQERRLQIEAEFQNNKAEIERLDNDRKAAHVIAVTEFEAEKKKFDDSKNTHARRRLLGRIEEILNDKAASNLSEATIAKHNKIVAYLQVFTGTLLCMASIAFAKIFFFAGNSSPVFVAIFSSSLLGGSASFIWLIKIKLSWFSSHASAELKNRAFVKDMLRSSWIVEMFYEWKDEKGDKLDSILVDRLTQNLFVNLDEAADNNHPAEEILASIGKIKTIRINKEGLEVSK